MKSTILTLTIIFIGITLFAQNNNDYQYDNLNRLKKVTYPNGTVYDYSYDQLGNRTVKVSTSSVPMDVDLVIQNPSLAQTSAAAGATVNVGARVANTGSGSSSGNFIKFYLSSNQTYEAGVDIEIGSNYNAAIAAGSYIQINSSIVIPQASAPGNWYILYYADATNIVSETNESNNVTALAFTIVDCSNIQLSTIYTDASCGLNNGSATVNVNGGTQPYSYLWTSGHTTATASNLAGNLYYVTVTDYYGCTSNTSVSLSVIDPIGVTINTTDATCGASNGSAELIINGGTSPFTYLWSNGQTTSTISDLSAGNYSVTVTDDLSCSAIESTVINTPGNLNLNLFSTNSSCGNSDGAISSNVSGGVEPYTFLWNNGQTTQTAINLLAGTYTLTVTDANECEFSNSATVTSTNSITLSFTEENTTCGNSNGTATVTAVSGTSPYTYLWSNGQTDQTAINLAAGTYNITVNDVNNCSAVSYAVVGSIIPLSAYITTTETSCMTSSGTATANVSNGTGPYLYNWSNGGTTQTITGLDAGDYTVTVTDQDGCETIANTVVDFENTGTSIVEIPTDGLVAIIRLMAMQMRKVGITIMEQ